MVTVRTLLQGTLKLELLIRTDTAISRAIT